MASMFIVDDPSKPESRTFYSDDKLPSLPLPSVEQTVEKYLDSCKAILTEDEYKHTYGICQKFIKNESKLLQEKLLERAHQQRNWLEEWWINKAYLETRTPLPLQNFSGPGTYLEHVWPLEAGSQLKHTALGQYMFMQFWQLIRQEKIAPHKVEGKYLTMHQFRYLFNTCRIPHKGKDELYHGFRLLSEGDSPSHVIILCRGYIFKMEGLNPKTGEIVSPPEIYHALKEIRKICSSRSKPGPGIPALTAMNRDEWATARDYLMNLSNQNKIALEDIETSINITALDDTNPRNYSEMSQDAMLGDESLRWYDRSYSAAFSLNGATMVNCEHTPYDAMVIVALVEFMTYGLKQCNGSWPGSWEIDADFPEPVELTFDLDDKMIQTISVAKQQIRKMRENLELLQIVFCKFGKSELKQVKIHPDFMVQTCLQLAYMHIHGKPAPAYETAMTRQFYRGRTETCRTCTPELVKFCRAMLDHPLPASKAYMELPVLLRKAQDKFLSLMKDCMLNMGCDRHLMGLVLTCVENGLEIPELFTDDAFIATGGNGNFALSTSCVGYMHGQGSVVPMIEDGYGCFYRINSHKLIYSVSAYRSSESTSAQQFADCFEYYMMVVLHLLQGTSKPSQANL